MHRAAAATAFLGAGREPRAGEPGHSPLDTPARTPFFTPAFALANTEDMKFALKCALGVLVCLVIMLGRDAERRDAPLDSHGIARAECHHLSVMSDVGRPPMKPSDLKRVVDRLRALGFTVVIRPGPVDRASRPMFVELEAKSHRFSIEERQAFEKFLSGTP